MSSAEGLFAIRYSGSSRASACLAGSSEGNGLSVIAITVRGMATLQTLGAGLKREHLRIDAVRQFMSSEERQDIVDDDIRHRLAHFGRGAAEMRREHHVSH